MTTFDPHKAPQLLEGDQLDAWSAATPLDIARMLDGVEVPWAIAAGHAIELFLRSDEPVRAHGDIEILVPESASAEVLERCSHLEPWVPTGDGRLARLPNSGAVRDRLLAESHQTWLRDPVSGEWIVDVFREPDASSPEMWACRRDPSLELAWSDVIERSPDGVPYLRPELVLLFKAKQLRPKDEVDLHLVLPRLAPDRKQFFADLLERIHRGHPWLELVRA